MPPHISRKRRSISPSSPSRSKRQKSSLFDTIDGRNPVTRTPSQTKAYLDNLAPGSSDSDAPSDDDFVDVSPASGPPINGGNSAESDIEDDNMDWEEVKVHVSEHEEDDSNIQDVTISIQENGSIAPQIDDKTAYVRKGPSKRDRQVRNGTHQIHVQCLMWHNTVRNAWLCNKELHSILVQGLSDGIKKEVDTWRRDMGMAPKYEQRPVNSGKKKRAAAKARKNRDARDWGHDADHLEKGGINMSRADPMLRLLKVMCAYWRKRFTVTAPGLRKLGYMPLKRLKEEVTSWKKNMSDHEQHGERVASVDELKNLARKSQGSRDLGAQLFTALMRALGFEARMVANLQPAGIGFGKSEDAGPRPKQSKSMETKTVPQKAKAKKKVVINLDSDGSGLSDLESDDIGQLESPNHKKYDRDLHFPLYWTEVLSPVTKKFIPVDPMVLSTVATNSELLATFEPRGKLADQAKQVMCYTIAHSTDGSAKDVTVRYLKKHHLPGRTKGHRMPVERIKVLNKRGKVLRYEDYEWFKTVMSGYERREHLRTTADDFEEATDLKPFKNEASVDKKTNDNSEAFYKASAEFVLEKHLRREEALIKDVEPVKEFTYVKGGKTLTDPVYKRSDVVVCKTAESWHKEGRQVVVGEQAMKWVPIRAVTAVRKAEIQAIERETGEKAKQGLFSRKQTEWIIPPPIGPDRQIPRNAFNNIDIYTPSMVPRGATHLPLRGTMRICENMRISYAEACIGFEFGNKRAVPVIQGVVVADEHADAVRDAWVIKEAERKRKEDAKKQVLALGLWKKMVVGLRIVERLRSEYRDVDDEADVVNPFAKKIKSAAPDLSRSEVPEAGGFCRPGEEDDDDDDEDAVPTADISLDLDHSAAETNGVLHAAAHDRADDHVKGNTEDNEAGGFCKTAEHESSDEVEVKPARKSRASAAAAIPTVKGSTRKVKTQPQKKPRASPTKSKYFKHDNIDEDDDDDDDNDENDDDDEDDDDDEEQEIVRPRRTTARTRANASL